MGVIYLKPHRPDIDSSSESADLCGEAGAPEEEFIQEMAEYVEAQTDCDNPRAWAIANFILSEAFRRRHSRR